MQNNISTHIAFFIGLSVLLSITSCKKDRPIYRVTPYNLNIPDHFPQMPIPEDNPMTQEGVKLGKKLFFDKMLSKDNSISCASCHRQENGFSDPNQFSLGVDGTVGTRQSMALINLGWQTSFFWDGRAGTLEEQIFFPVPDSTEMHLSWPEAVSRLKSNDTYKNMFLRAFNEEDFDSTHVSKAIAQYLRTLISSKSKYDIMYKFQNGLPLDDSEVDILNSVTTEEWGGMDLFFSLTGGDCLHCHDGPLMHTNIFSNNGLDMEFEDEGRYKVTGNPNDLGKFKVPTLRNIELTAPYMHDGRFQTLEEVVDHYSFGVQNSPTIDPMMEFAHQGGVQLDEYEKSLLVTFLKTFTDWEFTNNPEFQEE